MRLEQRSLLLTGASRGIGHATVKRFLEGGWHILTISRQRFAANCPWQAGAENHIQLDLADIGNVIRKIPDIRERLPDGKLHALVNNAAISPKTAAGGRLGTFNTDLTLWQQVFNVNFFATLALAQGLRDELIAAQGTIINVTSIAGTHVHPFAGSAYATSKAALAALTRELAADFGPHGVRVNAIAPGEIDTSILSPGTERIVESAIPMRRLGSPTEVADTIFFLCSPAASYINGAEIHINGGQHI
jgi:NAD(P)-dependent dehydrogenase (short-subunit alcohol dehydrogenase family)